MPRWVYFLLFVGFCVAVLHCVRGLRAVFRSRLQPVGCTQMLTGWSARLAGLFLLAPLAGTAATRGDLGKFLGLSGDRGELITHLQAGWNKHRAAKGDESARKDAAKECAAAVQGLLVAFGSDFTLFGLGAAMPIWVWTLISGHSAVRAGDSHGTHALASGPADRTTETANGEIQGTRSEPDAPSHRPPN